MALVGLLTNAVVTTVFMAQELWLGGTTPWPAVPDELLRQAGDHPPTSGTQ